MITKRLIIISAIILLLGVGIAHAQNRGADFKIGYVYLDEDGNQSVNHSSFNHYDGITVSLEKFRYGFKNGIQLRADLKNINLENRNLTFNLRKPGLFGTNFKSSQFRRIYDFDGDNFTRRNLTAAGIWFYPQKYIKVFAKGSFNNVAGKVNDLFGTSFITSVNELDYKQQKYALGARANYLGRMLRFEYSAINYDDKIDAGNDQTHDMIKLNAIMPVPKYERVQLFGGFNQFKTEYSETEFELKSTTYRGGASAKLTRNVTAKYVAMLNRAVSDSDYVDTDNLAQTFYVTFSKTKVGGITAGYQNDVNDDFEDSFKANSYYFSGWLMPKPNLEFKGELGIRAEEVDQGTRLIGNEDRNKFKISGKYRHKDKGSISFYVESKNRKNDQIGSEAEFIRFGPYMTGKCKDIMYCTWGYSYSKGKFKNSEQEFEFTDHQVHIDMNSTEFKGLTGGFGLTYYRSQRDLDVESIGLRFSSAYRVAGNHRIEVIYNAYNFDDLLALDQYYTENIVEINIIKEFSF